MEDPTDPVGVFERSARKRKPSRSWKNEASWRRKVCGKSIGTTKIVPCLDSNFWQNWPKKMAVFLGGIEWFTVKEPMNLKLGQSHIMPYHWFFLGCDYRCD